MQNVSDINGAVKLIRSEYLKKETEFQLKGEGCADLVEFVNDSNNRPAEWITQLYLSKSELALNGNLDLHGVVDDIAARYELDTKHIRDTLVKVHNCFLSLVLAPSKSCYPRI
jgi:hypothetical protein